MSTLIPAWHTALQEYDKMCSSMPSQLKLRLVAFPTPVLSVHACVCVCVCVCVCLPSGTHSAIWMEGLLMYPLWVAPLPLCDGKHHSVDAFCHPSIRPARPVSFRGNNKDWEKIWLRDLRVTVNGWISLSAQQPPFFVKKILFFLFKSSAHLFKVHRDSYRCVWDDDFSMAACAENVLLCWLWRWMCFMYLFTSVWGHMFFDRFLVLTKAFIKSNTVKQ